MPKRRFLHALKPCPIQRYDWREAHPLVKEMYDLAVKYEEVEAKLDSLRKQNPPPKALYRLSAHWTAANEFYLLLKLVNTEDFLKYVEFWTKGPYVAETIHSATYYVVSDGDAVGIYSGTSGIGIIESPMYVTKEEYARFCTTKRPMSHWLRSDVLSKVVSGIDSSDTWENEDDSANKVAE